MPSTPHQKIPTHRLLLYLLALSALPLLGVLYLHFGKMERLHEVKNRLEGSLQAACLVAKKQNANLAHYLHFSNSDTHWMEKHLESLALLGQEKEQVIALLSQENLFDPYPLQMRLQFLSSAENRLAFREGQVEEEGVFKEVQESLVHPVEVSGQDLIAILSLLERCQQEEKTAAKPPQILITDCKIERKQLKLGQEVFLLDLKLIKRDFS